MAVSARADLLGRLRKSIIFSLSALLHLSHTQCYMMRSQTAALFYITALQIPEALESKFGGLSGCSLAMEHNTHHAVCSAFPLQTSFKLQVTYPHFSSSTWHFLCLGMILWCEIFTKPWLTNLLPMPSLFFVLNAHGQNLGWCCSSQLLMLLLLLGRQIVNSAEGIMFSWYC